MTNRSLPVIIFGCGVALGGLITFTGMPVPKQNSSCVVPKVDVKTATAYVLKSPAPTVVPIETPAKCPAVSVSPKPENDTQKDLSVTDDTQTKPKRKRYRRHRIRSYWK
jgi:hypothetical protein